MSPGRKCLLLYVRCKCANILNFLPWTHGFIGHLWICRCMQLLLSVLLLHLVFHCNFFLSLSFRTMLHYMLCHSVVSKWLRPCRSQWIRARLLRRWFWMTFVAPNKISSLYFLCYHSLKRIRQGNQLSFLLVKCSTHGRPYLIISNSMLWLLTFSITVLYQTQPHHLNFKRV